MLGIPFIWLSSQGMRDSIPLQEDEWKRFVQGNLGFLVVAETDVVATENVHHTQSQNAQWFREPF